MRGVTVKSTPTTRRPPFVCVYGPPKCGKTGDGLMSFPGCAVFAGDPGAVKNANQLCGLVEGVDFTVHYAKGLADAAKACNQLLKSGKKPTAIIFDDFTRLVEQRFADLEKTTTGFALFGHIRDDVIETRDMLRDARIPAIVNTWERAAKIRGGLLSKGGPMLQGDLPEKFPGICDLVVRAVNDPDAPGDFKGQYQCEPSHPTYIMGDRDHVAPKLGPMNLGEILRAGGYVVPRLPAIAADQEELVQLLADALMEGDGEDDELLARAVAMRAAKKGWKAAHIRLTLRDGRDRYLIRKALADRDSVDGIVGSLFSSDALG